MSSASLSNIFFQFTPIIFSVSFGSEFINPSFEKLFSKFTSEIDSFNLLIIVSKSVILSLKSLNIVA